jgi:hypothetical protein
VDRDVVANVSRMVAHSGPIHIGNCFEYDGIHSIWRLSIEILSVRET